ncbi:MAG: bacillithiol biosynthesis cysteine-adding enzyme BshC [Bacillota bacterium]
MFQRVTALSGIYPPLFSRYVEQEAGVVAFFNGKFWDEKCYRSRAFFLQDCSFPREIRELLVDINSKLPVQPPAGWEEKLRDRRTLFVITGQQPGILAGPLLVLYKGLAAVKLARRLEALLQAPVQPLFWVASEDHNVLPLLRSYAPLRGGGISRIRLPLSPDGLPAGMLNIEDEAMADLLEQVMRLNGGKEHSDAVMEWLQSTAHYGGNNLSGWFMQIMSHLCAAAGLIFFDPLQASARGYYIPPLLQTLEQSCHLHDRIAAAEEELKACGFPLQVKRRGRETFIMITWGKKRYPLLHEREHYYTPGGELSLTRGELLKLIMEQPSLFSPGVLLRPLFQDILFPTLAYVAGPGELAYFAQIKGLYSLFNLEMPLLFPRPGVTLLEPALQEKAEQYNLKLDMLPGMLQDEQGPYILRENLWPRSRPQERVFNIATYLLTYGFTFWEEFCRNFPVCPGHYLYCWKGGV